MQSIKHAVVVRPLTKTLGAEVSGIDLRSALDTETVKALRSELLRWKVLFFRDQEISPEQQVAFGRAFGELDAGHPVLGHRDGQPEIYQLDARRTRESAAELSQGGRGPLRAPADIANSWHSDLTYEERPPLGSILRGVTVPPHGGDTIWSNLVAAYEALSAPLRGLLDGLTAVHRWRRGYERESAVPDDTPAAVQPVVAVHPDTGERALYVNPLFTSHIVDLQPHESEALLDLLYDQIRRPEFTVRFRWSPGSIAFWDNRATAHFALSPIDFADGEVDRVVERVTIVGDQVVGPTGVRSRSL